MRLLYKKKVGNANATEPWNMLSQTLVKHAVVQQLNNRTTEWDEVSFNLSSPQ